MVKHNQTRPSGSKLTQLGRAIAQLQIVLNENSCQAVAVTA
ncbi:MAG: hypothetical protein ABI180_10300 [Microcoleus sp.]